MNGLRFPIDKIKEIHSYINDSNWDEYSGYLFMRNGELRFINANRSEIINKPLPIHVYYDQISFHTHSKKNKYTISNQDIPSYKDLIFIKESVINNESPGHVLFTPYYVYYITISKDTIKNDSLIKKTYYTTLKNSGISPDQLKNNMIKMGIKINYTKSHGYTQNLIVKDDSIVDINYNNKNTYIFFSLLIVILIFIICIIKY